MDLDEDFERGAGRWTFLPIAAVVLVSFGIWDWHNQHAEGKPDSSEVTYGVDDLPGQKGWLEAPALFLGP
jgi:hypothetical protein